MQYELPTEPPFPAMTYAKDRVALASQFHADVGARYISNYENFWAIGREEVGIEEMQAILDALGATGIAILTDSAKYVGGILASFPDSLPEKYHSTPYEYIVEPPGRIVLTALKEAWVPKEDEETEDEEINE